jgi:hypothetical protein
MALSAAVVQTDITRRHRVVKLRVTPTVSYPTGGDTLDLTAITNPNALPGGYFSAAGIPTTAQVEVDENLAGASPKWVAGTTLANGKVKLVTAGAEHANAVYTAAELADSFVLVFRIPVGK